MSLERMIAPLRRRILSMVTRGIIRAVTDSGSIQKLQVSLLADELVDGVDRVQEYGFTSRPIPGGEVVAVFIGGNRDHGVVIASDDRRSRPTDLAEGEAAVYSSGKYQVRVGTDRIRVGKDGVFETVVVGETLAELLGHLIDDLAAHTHGAVGAPPATASTITGRKASYLTNEKILAKDGGRF